MNKLPLQKVARSRRDRIFIVAGPSCPRPSLEHPAPSFAKRKMKLLLQVAGTCSPSPSMGTCCPHVACGDNVGAARPRRPTGVKSQESRFKNASGASATQNRSEARLAWPQRIEGKQDEEAASSSTFDSLHSHCFKRARQECRASLGSRFFDLKYPLSSPLRPFR